MYVHYCIHACLCWFRKGSICFAGRIIFQLLVQNWHNADMKKIGRISLKLKFRKYESKRCVPFASCAKRRASSQRLGSAARDDERAWDWQLCAFMQSILFMDFSDMAASIWKGEKRNYKHTHLRISGNYPNAQILPRGQWFSIGIYVINPGGEYILKKNNLAATRNNRTPILAAYFEKSP